MVLGFIGVALAAVLIYTLLKPIWTHWLFWLSCSLVISPLIQAIYFVCCSGIVYCIIHDVPLFREGPLISNRNRSQTGIEGWILSGVISTVGLLLMLVAIAGEKCRASYSVVLMGTALLLIWMGVKYVQTVYRNKGWYGPSFFPPGSYLRGPLNVDQGNNI